MFYIIKTYNTSRSIYKKNGTDDYFINPVNYKENDYLKSFLGVIPLVVAAAAITLTNPPAINGIVPIARTSYNVGDDPFTKLSQIDN